MKSTENPFTIHQKNEYNINSYVEILGFSDLPTSSQFVQDDVENPQKHPSSSSLHSSLISTHQPEVPEIQPNPSPKKSISRPSENKMELTTSPKTTSQPPTKEIDELPDVVAEPSQLIQDTENIKSKMEEESVGDQQKNQMDEDEPKEQTEILNNEHLNEEKMVVEEPLSTEKEVQTNSKQSEPTHMEEVVEENKEKEQSKEPSKVFEDTPQSDSSNALKKPSPKHQDIIPSTLDLKKTSKVSSPSTISDKRYVSNN
ncbi:hypothetical protein QTN25_004086 [Entamoeba marina]